MSSLLESLGLRHDLVPLAAVVFGIVFFVAAYEWMRKGSVAKTAAKPDDIEWKTPSPKPLPDFDLDVTKPQLYRPFRHGPNHVTMGIRKLDWNNWIEMDSNFMWFHDTKVSELEKDIDAHVQYVDNAVTRDACFEVLEELTAWLTVRYPKIFSLEGGKLRNSLTGEAFDYPASDPKEAMATAAKLVQDDLVIMVEEDDGHYHLDAGAVCLPGFWRLSEKFRMSLDTLHIEAKVPHYQTKLQRSMNKFFKSMQPDKAVVRNNFFIQLDDGLHWSHRMGDQNSNEVASWETANDKGLTIEDLYFRSERQSLRRLPRSKALLFTIRTYFEPITRIAQEPHVPGRLAEAIDNWDEAASLYKGKHHWEGILLPYLREQDAKQKESGILEKAPEGSFPY
ncbi:wlm-like protein [Fusarium flagelliforme]|uniref:Wlm-like protein n=1 Tax=Fusarium flagelliforme TaxID=2675880 RepID=A0A395M704_9HYPO|nr:wlm-like protein [Fusarium flagelliforme]